MDSNINFDIKNHAVLKLGGVEVWITDTLISTWIVMGVLIIFAIAVRVSLKKFKTVPKGFQNVVELLVEMFDNFMFTSGGEKFMFLGNWFFTVFAFILVSNISGLFFMRPPTADWATALALALVTFALIHVCAARNRGFKHLKSFIEPSPVFLPLNLIGEIARPISLSFRLFGNVLGGLILLGLIYAMVPVFAKFVIPSALHAFFDVFVGAIQTYVFCILSLAFIRSSAAPEDG